MLLFALCTLVHCAIRIRAGRRFRYFCGKYRFSCKKFLRWATCPQKQTRPSHRARKTGWTCSNLALDRLPNPPAKVDVWRISQDFGVSPRILAYHPGTLPTFGISLWHGVHEQWEAVRFDRVKHTGVLCLVPRRWYKDAESKTHQRLIFAFLKPYLSRAPHQPWPSCLRAGWS